MKKIKALWKKFRQLGLVVILLIISNVFLLFNAFNDSNSRYASYYHDHYNDYSSRGHDHEYDYADEDHEHDYDYADEKHYHDYHDHDHSGDVFDENKLMIRHSYWSLHNGFHKSKKTLKEYIEYKINE